jgi:protocatechuate 3,4-dioxygenase beta subunit
MNLRGIIIIIFFFLILVSSTKSSLAGEVCSPTQTDVEGPYYVPDAPFRTALAEPGEPGERVVIRGLVLRTDCKTPVQEALIEVWQTDSSGKYHYKEEGYRLRGQMRAEKKGYYEFSTIKPGRYRIAHGFRPAHIHMKVSHPDYEVVTTQLYFRGDPYLWPNDACGRACKSNDPLRIIELKKQTIKGQEVIEGRFNIILKSRGQ